MLRAAGESGGYHFFTLGLLMYLFLLLKAVSSSDVRAPGLAASEGASPGLGVFNHLIMETLAYMFSSSTPSFLFFFFKKENWPHWGACDSRENNRL